MTRIQWNTSQSLHTTTRDYLYIKQHILSGSRSGHVMARWGKSSCVTWTLTKSKTLTRPEQSKNNNNNNNDNKLNKKKKLIWPYPYLPVWHTANSSTSRIILFSLWAHSPFQLWVDLITKGHNKLPVLIFISGVCGLLCKNTKGKTWIHKLAALPCPLKYESIHKTASRVGKFQKWVQNNALPNSDSKESSIFPSRHVALAGLRPH